MLERTRNRLRSYARFLTLGAAIGTLQQLAAHGSVGAPAPVAGALISLGFTALHLEFYPRFWPTLPLALDVAGRSAIAALLAAVMLAGVIFGGAALHGAPMPHPTAVARHPAFIGGVAGVFGAYLVITAIVRVSGLLGPGVLLRYVTGRYHRPRSEDRVFLFVDLNDATTHAERLGHAAYFELLRDYFQAMTQPIEESRAQVVQYVGDQVVLTWLLADAARDHAAVRLTFGICDALAARRSHFVGRYGFAPGLKAGLHGGPVVSGEISGIRSELVFSGDVLNTTQRLQGEAGRIGATLVASATVLDALGAATSGLTLTPLGPTPLKGKTLPVELVRIDRPAAPAPPARSP